MRSSQTLRHLQTFWARCFASILIRQISSRLIILTSTTQASRETTKRSGRWACETVTFTFQRHRTNVPERCRAERWEEINDGIAHSNMGNCEGNICGSTPADSRAPVYVYNTRQERPPAAHCRRCFYNPTTMQFPPPRGENTSLLIYALAHRYVIRTTGPRFPHRRHSQLESRRLSTCRSLQTAAFGTSSAEGQWAWVAFSSLLDK